MTRPPGAGYGSCSAPANRWSCGRRGCCWRAGIPWWRACPDAWWASGGGRKDVERLGELVGRSSRVGDSVCVRSFQATVGAVGCVDTARGVVRWTRAASGAEGVDGDGDAIFGTESNGTVVAWRRSDGTRLWDSDRLKHRKLTAPLLLGRSVVVGDD